MLTRLFDRLRKTVTVTIAPGKFSFASAPREAAIDTTVRVGAGGRILGFGDAGPTIQTQLRPIFTPGPSAAVAVDEPALVALCRRGFSLVLGPGLNLRPRVVVRGARRAGLPQETLLRALRNAGAETVELSD